MNRLLLLLIAIGLGIAIGYAIPREPNATPPPAPAAVEAVPTREITARDYQVAAIVDGDTFKIIYDGELTKVRIDHIDTPERGQPNYDQATEALRDMIEGQTITIAFTDPVGKRDNWGRLLCTVYVDGQDVGEAMIAAGLAERWTD